MVLWAASQSRASSGVFQSTALMVLSPDVQNRPCPGDCRASARAKCAPVSRAECRQTVGSLSMGGKRSVETQGVKLDDYTKANAPRK
jgi:hypothetical protein